MALVPTTSLRSSGTGCSGTSVASLHAESDNESNKGFVNYCKLSGTVHFLYTIVDHSLLYDSILNKNTNIYVFDLRLLLFC